MQVGREQARVATNFVDHWTMDMAYPISASAFFNSLDYYLSFILRDWSWIQGETEYKNEPDLLHDWLRLS